jgi:hypothetical protein
VGRGRGIEKERKDIFSSGNQLQSSVIFVFKIE